MRKTSASSILFFVFISIPLAVNLWKVFGRGYTLYEIWPHLLLDAAVMALFFFLLITNPLENPTVYAALYGLFSVTFLIDHTPDGLVDWIATIAVLAVLGIVAFPRLVAVMPWVLLGLLISYYGILRTYLPELNRTEVVEVLDKKSAPETAREFMRTLLGYERNTIGREKYRYFLHDDDDFKARLKKAGALHAQAVPDLHKAGISYIEWDNVRGSGTEEVVFRAGTAPARTVERDENGLQKQGLARMQEFRVKLKQMPDGTYRVTDFPEEFTAVLESKPQF